MSGSCWRALSQHLCTEHLESAYCVPGSMLGSEATETSLGEWGGEVVGQGQCPVVRPMTLARTPSLSALGEAGGQPSEEEHL